MTEKEKPARPRNIANDILDVVETATSKWTRQKKSEERHPGNIRYRASRTALPARMPRSASGQAAGAFPGLPTSPRPRERILGLPFRFPGRDAGKQANG